MMGVGQKDCLREMVLLGGVMGVSRLGFGVKIQRSRAGPITLLDLQMTTWIEILMMCSRWS